MQKLQAEGGLVSLWVASGFAVAAVAILMLRESVVRYRPGQWAPHDIVSRVDFAFRDEKRLADAKRKARENQPRVYKLASPDPWTLVDDRLMSLPDRVAGSQYAELPPDLRELLDAGTLAKLQEYQTGPPRAKYQEWVRAYVAAARAINLVVLPEADRREDIDRTIVVPTISPAAMRTELTYAAGMRDEIAAKLNRPAADNFVLSLQPKIVNLTLRVLAAHPTHTIDEVATADARNRAEQVDPSAGDVLYKANMPLVRRGEISEDDWLILQAENEQYNTNLRGAAWIERLGLAGAVVLLTIALSLYVVRYQPRVVRNHARGIAIAVLMLSMLLVAQLAAVGTSQTYFFGMAPTILVAMILAIAYDQRFAVGMATFHAVLVTLALSADLGFFLIVEAGVITSCSLLGDLRTRSKLIEVGGATAIAMIAATAAAGALQSDPWIFIAKNCLFSGAAGLAVGFLVLGILPFIERAFRITTSMTLLELADASHPLLRRLSLEAPGTYNHSLQVATLAEEAAEAIGANALLCRVASYYHDVGKINKAEYFVENQTDGTNRHINLSPSVSLLIIIGHVKDGIELAKEYNLPTSILPFIQQHHGTTIVEFFYRRACDAADPQQPAISETEYRYPGPKPKSKEIAIVMISDAVESATRAMAEPTAARIETLVNEIAMKRLLDGQLDECDLTMRDLERVQRSLIKSLLGIYHGRIAYPSTISITGQMGAAAQAKTA